MVVKMLAKLGRKMDEQRTNFNTEMRNIENTKQKSQSYTHTHTPTHTITALKKYAGRVQQRLDGAEEKRSQFKTR